MAASSLSRLWLFLAVLSWAVSCRARGVVDKAAWSGVDEVLKTAIDNGAFPGAVALVADKSGVLYQQAAGSFTYGSVPPFNAKNEPMLPNTMFDMASCTKVVSTTSVIALLYQDGLLDLHMRVADPQLLGPAYGVNGKQNITVLNCLLHNAGYPPDPSPNYWNPPFGCPQTSHLHPEENWSCRARIFQGLLQQKTVRGPNEKYVYSDLSFLTLMWVAGRVVHTNAARYGLSEQSLIPGCLGSTGNSPSSAALYQCYYEAFVRTQVFDKLSLLRTGFLPPRSLWGQCAPAENDTVYLHRVIQGQVSDGNAYALGGIAGHAGLFSTALDVYTFMDAYMFRQPSLLNASTYSLFIKEHNHSQSSRALGWNTNDPSVFDEGWNKSCGPLSSKTFMHLGYTGTMICGDPIRGIIVILLTNRVYPTAQNIKIERVRQLFSAAVVKALDVLDAEARSGEDYAQLLRREYELYKRLKNIGLAGSRPKEVPATAIIPFEYPLFKQCNKSWGSHVIEHETICEVGCLMSSISMAIRGKHIMIETVRSNPGTLNEYLRTHNGYTQNDDLKEAVIPSIDPAAITWVGPANATAFSREEVIGMLQKKVIVIINVMEGRHFVLVTGYDTDPTKENIWYVNDPGFTRDTYTQADIVGYRIFDMQYNSTAASLFNQWQPNSATK